MELNIDIAYAYFSVIMMIVGIFIGVIYTILFIGKRAGLWGIFSKAGEKEWKSIVPVYNQITLLKICKLNPWFIVLYLDFIIPFIGYIAGRDVKWITIIMLVGLLIYRFLIAIRLGQAFKKGDVFSFFTAFFQSILFPVLGCSKNEKFGDIVVRDKKKIKSATTTK
ncbi:MAG: hypothetical protein IKE01_06725 [Clostridia bacterium]|nr:hypothetical protein [Clostridia bacterium]